MQNTTAFSRQHNSQASFILIAIVGGAVSAALLTLLFFCFNRYLQRKAIREGTFLSNVQSAEAIENRINQQLPRDTLSL